MNKLDNHNLKVNANRPRKDENPSKKDRLILLLREIAEWERQNSNYTILKPRERELLGYIDLKAEEIKDGIAPGRKRRLNQKIENAEEVVLANSKSIKERHMEKVVDNDN